MAGEDVVVLDVGKTRSKLSLWSAEGGRLAQLDYGNRRREGSLDAQGIAAWLIEGLRHLGSLGDVGTIVPVAHGAALAVLRDGALAFPPADYEDPIPPAIHESYDRLRDPFARTGSPRLANGLNAGVQLAALEPRRQDALAGATIVPWAQYWSWYLSGVPASELTSLGCHTDLWFPFEARPSDLAIARGWAERLAPIRAANEYLGTIRPDLAEATGLSAAVQICCGIHDSNAALLAARAHLSDPEEDITVLSTGTWFVAVRSGRLDSLPELDESLDCLINVDAAGRPVPSARYMGGREIADLLGSDAAIDAAGDQASLIKAAARLAQLAPAISGASPGVPSSWRDRPIDPDERRAAVALHAGLMVDAMLDRIGARGTLLIEGRFTQAETFVRTLAALRPEMTVKTIDEACDASFGGLLLARPAVRPPMPSSPVAPFAFDLATYAARWRAQDNGMPTA